MSEARLADQEQDFDEHRLRSKMSGWHFGQESLTEGEREILHVAERLIRICDDRRERGCPTCGEVRDCARCGQQLSHMHYTTGEAPAWVHLRPEGNVRGTPVERRSDYARQGDRE